MFVLSIHAPGLFSLFVYAWFFFFHVTCLFCLSQHAVNFFASGCIHDLCFFRGGGTSGLTGYFSKSPLFLGPSQVKWSTLNNRWHMELRGTRFFSGLLKIFRGDLVGGFRGHIPTEIIAFFVVLTFKICLPHKSVVYPCQEKYWICLWFFS